MDYVGNLCEQTIHAFSENKTRVPSWGKEVDIMVQKYVKGLQDWIVGYVYFAFVHFFQVFLLVPIGRSLHWSFKTHRYFGSEGQQVKKHRIVKLLPSSP